MVRVFILGAVFVIGTMCAFGQDLGSSNKLFGGTKSTPAAKTAKKAPAKRKVVAKAPGVVKKPVASGPKKTTHTPAPVAKTEPARPKTEPKKVEISTPEPKNSGMAPGKAADDLFNKLIEEGNAARDERNYADAESVYRRATTVKPKDSRAVFGLGNLFTDQQRWEDAEAAYRTAIQLEPDNALAHIALSYVLTQPITAPNLSDRYEEAERLARRSIELARTNALAFDQLGVSLELRGMISEETDRAYRRSIQLDPSFAPAYAHLGRLLRRRGLTRESAEAYESAVRNSTDVSTMVLVADVMQSEQRYAESADLLRKAIANDPKNPAALMMLGRALTTIGRYGEAESMLRRSREVSPNGFLPNSLLGTLFSRQGRFEMAENALLQALRFVSPNEKRGLSRQFEVVGDGYFKTGKAANAERAYRQAVALDAENGSLAGKLTKAQHS